MAKRCVEVKVATAADSGELMGLLADLEPLGGWESDGFVYLYWPEDSWDGAFIDRIVQAAQSLLQSAEHPQISAAVVPDQDWNLVWAQSIRPINVGPRIVIRQSWNSAPLPANGVGLVIDPKRAFGTGHHATTQLALEYLQEADLRGCSVLDVGTGSGILAMAAVRLGAVSCLAIDLDPEAIECAQECLQVNGFGNEVELRVGSLESVGAQTFDVVLANLDRNTLVHHAAGLLEKVKADGILLVSGILTQDRGDIMDAVSDAGGKVRSEKSRDEWTAMAIVKLS
jgi:ribosomal protein L11 methyltransferase